MVVYMFSTLNINDIVIFLKLIRANVLQQSCTLTLSWCFRMCPVHLGTVHPCALGSNYDEGMCTPMDQKQYRAKRPYRILTVKRASLKLC